MAEHVLWPDTKSGPFTAELTTDGSGIVLRWNDVPPTAVEMRRFSLAATLGKLSPPKAPYHPLCASQLQGVARLRFVAELYRRAVRSRQHPRQVIADSFGVYPLSTIDNWIAEARRTGLLPKTERGKVTA